MQHNAKRVEEENTEPSFRAFAVNLDPTDRSIIDSGASSHMTRSKHLLAEYREFERLGLGDGSTVDVLGIGKVCMKMHSNVKGVLYHVLYVPELTCNLFSVKAAVAMGNTVKFGSNKCWIRD